MGGDEIPYKDREFVREGSLSRNPEELSQLESRKSQHRTGREGRREHLQKKQNNAEVSYAIPVKANPVLQFTSVQKETSPLSEAPQEGGAGSQQRPLSLDMFLKSLKPRARVVVEYKHTSFYFASLCSALQILQFLHIEGLWQPCIKQVYWHHFSSSVCSLHVSVSHFGNSCDISDVFSVTVFVMVICDQ